MMTDYKFYVKELRSEECQCSRPKKPNYSFCYHCYFQLPKDMRRDLYQKLGEGYEAAYDEAVTFLTSE